MTAAEPVSCGCRAVVMDRADELERQANEEVLLPALASDRRFAASILRPLADRLPAEPVASATEPDSGQWGRELWLACQLEAWDVCHQHRIGELHDRNRERDAALARAEGAERELEERRRARIFEGADRNGEQITHERVITERDAALARAESAEREREQLAQQNGRLGSDLDRLAAELATARACSTCGGSPHPSGRVCVCGGSGTKEAEVVGLRGALFDVRAELATARRDAANKVRQMAALFSFRSLALTVSEAKYECLRVADDIERGPAKEG